jgi:hypothetical protein
MAADDKQLSFDFMHVTPKQRSPQAEYAAYVRSIRDEKPPTVKGTDNVTQTQRRKDVRFRRKV